MPQRHRPSFNACITTLSRTTVLLATLIATCSTSREESSDIGMQAALPDSALTACAKQAASALGGALPQVLTSEVQRGGPAAAIAV